MNIHRIAEIVLSLLLSAAVAAAEDQQKELNDWLNGGGGSRLEHFNGRSENPTWDPEAFGVPCNQGLCGPGIGPPVDKTPLPGATVPAKQPTIAPCGVTKSCGPGVGFDGGVVRPQP